MPELAFETAYPSTGPESYERYFVPAVSLPLARDLVAAAALRPGERVLDVACGTGVVTRLASERVGPSGSVAGLDVNAGMLEAARAVAAPGPAITWYETSAEAMPLPDASLDVVLCQLGLQFISAKLAALREMRRVLAPTGRVLISVPGPAPALIAILAEALAEHIGPGAAGFARLVFSLYDEDEISELLDAAGFVDVTVERARKDLPLPAPADFLWQYIHGTPLAAAVAGASDERRAALERDVTARWQEIEVDGRLTLEISLTTATARVSS
jgi:ubiquinone/menaquinone biosynthesis C-methylase UbiE